jgi:hypothetical protein
MNSPTTTPASMSDRDLVVAYLDDIADSSLGVDYFLAQEMERRGLRDPATAELTETARVLGPEDLPTGCGWCLERLAGRKSSPCPSHGTEWEVGRSA